MSDKPAAEPLSIDTSDEACAVACMLVSNPQGALRCDGDGWQKRVNDLIRVLRDERNALRQRLAEAEGERDLVQVAANDISETLRKTALEKKAVERQLASAVDALRWYASEDETEEFRIVDSKGEFIVKFRDFASRARETLAALAAAGATTSPDDDGKPSSTP